MNLTNGNEAPVDTWVEEVLDLLRPYVRALADTYVAAGVPAPISREQAQELFERLTKGADIHTTPDQQA